MTFKLISSHVVLYWCVGLDIHSSIVTVPRNRKPWERVFCPNHKLWMHQQIPDIDDAQGPLPRND